MTNAVSMRAVRLERWGAPPVLVEVPIPVPRDGELLLRVDAAGICHSDLHVMDVPAGTLPYTLPFTLGHEVAGTVMALGDDVDERWRGQSVVVHGVWSCGVCRNCRRGRENYCLSMAGAIGGGLGLDGGLADFMLVPSERHLVPTSGLEPRVAVPLTDAGLTAFHAVRPHRDALTDRGSALVLGVGGLGHLAIQILVATTGAVIAAVDTRDGARDLARGLGAQVVASDAARAGAEMRALTGEPGFDVIFDFVGDQGTLDSTLPLLAPGGSISVVGSGGGRLSVGKDIGLPRGWGIQAPFWGPRSDLVELVELARTGVVSAEIEVFGLDDALSAYELLRNGGIRGRAVVVPQHAPQRLPSMDNGGDLDRTPAQR